MTFKDWLIDWIDYGGVKSERSLINTHGYPNSSTALSNQVDIDEELEDAEEQEPVPRRSILGRRGATILLQTTR